MTDAELKDLIALGHETRGVEFKGGGPFGDFHLRARVFKAMIAMANRRDGGVVIVGVAEPNPGTLVATGVSSVDEQTWDYDSVAPSLASFTAPSISFTREVRTVDGHRCVVLSVQEFHDLPILCTREHITPANPTGGRPTPIQVLRPAAMYVRSRRKPESTEVATLEDMRELIELAVEKAVLRHGRLARLAAGAIAAQEVGVDARAQYQRELEELR